LISELDVVASAGRVSAASGGTITTAKGSSITLTIRFRDPDVPNAHGDNPRVSRLDVITGQVAGPVRNRNSDRNESTKVAGRFAPSDWQSTGDLHVITTTLSNLQSSMFVRVRGTNTADADPPMDAPGESPWADLWFYSNPIFIDVR
jgi:hypothetical protein